MSFVALAGNPSGTGTLTVSAPNTNSNRALALPDASGELALQQRVLAGTGQTLQNLSGSRATNTNYTNSTGRPIHVTTTINAATTAGVSWLMDGVEFATTNVLSNLPAALSFIVPPGSVYRVNSTSTVLRWFELRD